MMSKYDGSRLFELLDQNSRNNTPENRYKEATDCLDKAADLLDLPKGYYYSNVTVEDRSITLIDDYGESATTLLHNHDLSQSGGFGVPRFEGESIELWFKRFPPDKRPIIWFQLREQILTGLYGERGGGKRENLAKSRFEAVSILLIASYVPGPDIFEKPYKFIEQLLAQCGIKKSSKDIASVINERKRPRKQSDNQPKWSGMGSDPSVALLGLDKRIAIKGKIVQASIVSAPSDNE